MKSYITKVFNMTFCLGHNGLLMTIEDFKKWDFEGQVLYCCIETMLFCISSEACERSWVGNWLQLNKLLLNGSLEVGKESVWGQTEMEFKVVKKKIVLGNDINILERNDFALF